MNGNAVKSNLMAKKKALYAEGEKPLTFKQAIWLATHTPHKTHKQIIEERKKEKLNRANEVKVKK